MTIARQEIWSGEGTVVNRYYDPATEQFLSVDPAVDQTGTPYAFTGGDPVNGSDPGGTVPEADFSGEMMRAAIREALQRSIKNPDLRSMMNELYRPGARFGDGGTADMLEEEVLNSSFRITDGAIDLPHYIKAFGALKNLSKLVRNENLCSSDTRIALAEIRDLTPAVQSATDAINQEVEIGRDLGFNAVEGETELLTGQGEDALSLAERVLDDFSDFIPE